MGLLEEEKEEHVLHLTEMSQLANDRYRRYRGEQKFKEILSEVSFVPIAVHLYQKLEGGNETDSAYQNDYYFFKRVSQQLKEEKIKKISINSII